MIKTTTKKLILMFACFVMLICGAFTFVACGENDPSEQPPLSSTDGNPNNLLILNTTDEKYDGKLLVGEAENQGVLKNHYEQLELKWNSTSSKYELTGAFTSWNEHGQESVANWFNDAESQREGYVVLVFRVDDNANLTVGTGEGEKTKILSNLEEDEVVENGKKDYWLVLAVGKTIEGGDRTSFHYSVDETEYIIDLALEAYQPDSFAIELPSNEVDVEGDGILAIKNLYDLDLLWDKDNYNYVLTGNYTPWKEAENVKTWFDNANEERQGFVILSFTVNDGDKFNFEQSCKLISTEDETKYYVVLPVGKNASGETKDFYEFDINGEKYLIDTTGLLAPASPVAPDPGILTLPEDDLQIDEGVKAYNDGLTISWDGEKYILTGNYIAWSENPVLEDWFDENESASKGKGYVALVLNVGPEDSIEVGTKEGENYKDLTGIPNDTDDETYALYYLVIAIDDNITEYHFTIEGVEYTIDLSQLAIS